MSSAKQDVDPDRSPATGHKALLDLLARVITEVFAPWVIVFFLPLAVAWQAAPPIAATLHWGLLVSVTSSLLPMAVVAWGARTGRWEGHHVRNRAGRLVPFLTLIGSSVLGLALLVLLHAPSRLIALDTAILVSLFVTGAITIKWKISMHSAVAAGTVIVLVHTYSPILWLLALPVALIAWSRVQMNDHTTAQVVVGAIVGAAIGGVAYAVLT